MRQVVTLGDLVDWLERLEIRCRRCERRGLIRLARLIEEHGAEMALPEPATGWLQAALERPRPTCRAGAASTTRFWCASREPAGLRGEKGAAEAAPPSCRGLSDVEV